MKQTVCGAQAFQLNSHVLFFRFTGRTWLSWQEMLFCHLLLNTLHEIHKALPPNALSRYSKLAFQDTCLCLTREALPSESLKRKKDIAMYWILRHVPVFGLFEMMFRSASG